MTIKSYFLSIIVPLLIGSATTQTTYASQINWGNAVYFEDVAFTSSGGSLDTGFTFALGTFGDPNLFTPSISNATDWATNWKLLDTAPYNSANDFFSKSTSLLSNATFAAGEVAYIWIYNTMNYEPGTEWFLVSDATWTIPAATTSQTELPLQWRVNDATNLVFGGKNNVQGSGDYSTTPPSFAIQTHTLAPIPEPTSVGLTLLAGLGLLARRRRL